MDPVVQKIVAKLYADDPVKGVIEVDPTRLEPGDIVVSRGEVWETL